VRDMIADGASQHRVLRLEGVEHRALGDRTLDVKLNFRTDSRQRTQMAREDDANHGSV